MKEENYWPFGALGVFVNLDAPGSLGNKARLCGVIDPRVDSKSDSGG